MCTQVDLQEGDDLKKQILLMQFVFLDTVCVVVFLGDVSIYETSEV